MDSTTDLLEPVADATGDRDGYERPAAPAAGTPSTDGESGTAVRRPRGTGLAAMVLPELQSLATGLGISGTGRMRKGQLITAIQTAQGGGSGPVPAAGPSDSARGSAPTDARTDAPAGRPTAEAPSQPTGGPSSQPNDGASSQPTGAPSQSTADAEPAAPAQAAAAPTGTADTEVVGGTGAARTETERRPRERQQGDRPDRHQGDRQQGDRQQGDRQRQGGQGGGQGSQQGTRTDGPRTEARNDSPRNDGPRDDDDEAGGRGRRGRYRDRRNRQRERQGLPAEGGEPVARDDDVLVDVAGIVHMLDSYGFIRTSGYLPGPNDVYVSLQQVRRYGIRPGDAVTGAVRQAVEGDRKEKYNPLIRLDAVNGLEPEAAKKRPEFAKLVPLYPQERLRLETEPGLMTTRVIDLVSPIGKGQRGLIVSPPKAGKTMVLQAIANAITTNNPEVHLMVVLVDERPEEVTDMQRTVKGEVIASTFDRHPADHTVVAELAIERAKRLVEMGHDVVVLLDSLTRLGRAYNLAAPASGRILTGGVDSAALYPPKRFLGAARNIEDGGSLTILASALVETGSAMDQVIFEEFKGTGNMELKLDRKLADKRIFPAIDVDASSTRKEDLLMSPEELQIIHKLRRVMSALDREQGINLLLDRMKTAKTNVEFLLSVQKTTPGADNS